MGKEVRIERERVREPTGVVRILKTSSKPKDNLSGADRIAMQQSQLSASFAIRLQVLRLTSWSKKAIGFP
jgi:hypothetical protein